MALLHAWARMAEGFLTFQDLAARIDYSDMDDQALERALPHLQNAEQYGTLLYASLGNLATCMGLPRTIFQGTEPS